MISLVGKRETAALLFPDFQRVCCTAVHSSLVTHPFGVTMRLCSRIVALCRHLHYRCFTTIPTYLNPEQKNNKISCSKLPKPDVKNGYIDY